MHTHFKKGQRILLIYRDGRPNEIHRFVERLRASLLLEGGITVRVDTLRSIGIYKDPTSCETPRQHPHFP